MILAIDLGSTSFKTGLFDEKLQLCASSSASIEYDFAEGGRVELPVGRAEEAFRLALSEVFRQKGVRNLLPERPEGCCAQKIPDTFLTAIAITSQAQTFTVLDAVGNPKIPFISWQDARADQTCASVGKEKADHPFFANFAHHSSFGQPLGALQACQLLHLRLNLPELLTETDRVVHLPTYFVEKLTGRSVIDSNLAAMSGLYSLAERGWWSDALELIGLRRLQLSELVDVGEVAATTTEVASEFGLPTDLPVTLAGNDQTSGAFGAEIEESGSVLVTLGTAQAAYAFSEDLPEATDSLIRGPYPGGGFYRLTSDSCGGSIINWARSLLAGCDSPEAFSEQAAASESGCRGLVFDADLLAGRGGWKNVGIHHTAADFARSVLEELSRRTVRMVDSLGLEKQSSFLLAGGGSRSTVWREILADMFGATVSATEASPLRGAARMAKK